MFGGKIGLPELLIILVVIALIVKAGRSRSFAAALLGLLLGAFGGFLLRPSVAMIGQLPFETVITRGTNLTGLNVVLRSAAEQSFNYMVVSAIVGGVVLGIWGTLASKAKPDGTKAQAAAAAAAGSSNNVTTASGEMAFCSKCGKGLSGEVLFCSACGAKKV